MVKVALKEEKVYSPFDDVNIKKNLNDSQIWKNAYKKEELTLEVLNRFPNGMVEYTIKFDGLTPVQVTNIKPYRG